MGEHYVPRKHLSRFAAPEDRRMIWMYDKRQGKWSHPAISRVAQQANFYGPEIEKQLNRKVERPANIVFEKLRLHQHINDAERWNAALYIATMQARVPIRRARARKMVPAAVESILSELATQIEKWASGKTPEEIARRRAEFERASAAVRENPFRGPIIHHIQKPWPTETVVRTIYAMAWRVGKTASATPFVTSDNPVHFFTSLGLAQPTSELTFAFAADTALYGSWRGEIASTLFFSASKPLVKECNRRIVHGADRFIFSREPEKWIASVAANESPIFNQIGW